MTTPPAPIDVDELNLCDRCKGYVERGEKFQPCSEDAPVVALLSELTTLRERLDAVRGFVTRQLNYLPGKPNVVYEQGYVFALEQVSEKLGLTDAPPPQLNALLAAPPTEKEG